MCVVFNLDIVVVIKRNTLIGRPLLPQSMQPHCNETQEKNFPGLGVD